ncbi:MAG: InlB B-repeat-containing protein, partial [Oscillospiraceae bacterium]|nr:InlB B-repeat-containing protein [Oscillospiraceae bacterium]
MKNSKKILILILIMALIIGPAAHFALAAEVPAGYQAPGTDLYPNHAVIVGPGGGFQSPVNQPTTPFGAPFTVSGLMTAGLLPGEVWTGRHVTYERVMDEDGFILQYETDEIGELSHVGFEKDGVYYDLDKLVVGASVDTTEWAHDYSGWVTATLYAQARPYIYEDPGEAGRMISTLLDLADPYVYMTSHLGELSFADFEVYRGVITGDDQPGQGGYYVDEDTVGVFSDPSNPNSHYVVWRVHQDLIIDQPGETTIRLWLGEKPDGGIFPEDDLGRVFTSENTRAWFKPAVDNDYYYTKSLRTDILPTIYFDRFSMNNGNGMDSTTFTDSTMNLRIPLPIGNPNNPFPDGRPPYLADGTTLNPAANWYRTTSSGLGGYIAHNYLFNLYWTKNPSGPNIYTFTFRECDSSWLPTGLVMTYRVDVSGLSGNEVRVVVDSFEVTSTNYFPRPASTLAHHYYASRLAWGTDTAPRGVENLVNRVTGNLASFPVFWDRGTVIQSMEGTLSMALRATQPPSTDLIVHKSLTGFWEQDWDVDEDSPFGFRVQNQFDLYLILNPVGEEEIDGVTYMVYEYGGVTQYLNNPTIHTVVYTSEEKPAYLRNIPVESATSATEESAEPITFDYTVTEVFTGSKWEGLEDWQIALITSTFYDVDGETLRGLRAETRPEADPDLNPFDELTAFSLEEGVLREVTLQNKFGHGVGFLEVTKFINGYPDDQGVTDDALFYVRIWDVSAENYLLFDSVPRLVGDNETVWCVGNHIIGLTETYTQYLENQAGDYVDEDGNVVDELNRVGRPQPIMEIPIQRGKLLVLSNLWTWGAYEVHEVIPVPAALNGIYLDLIQVELIDPQTGEPTGEFADEYPPVLSPLWQAAVEAMIAEQWTEVWAGIPNTDRDFDWAIRGPMSPPVWPAGAWMEDAWKDQWELVYEIIDESNFCLDTRVDWGVEYVMIYGDEPELRFNEVHTASLYNKFKYQSANVMISKELRGHYLDWGIGPNSWFDMQIWNIPDTNPELATELIFMRERISGALGYRYHVIGHRSGESGPIDPQTVHYYWLEEGETGAEKYAAQYASGYIVDVVRVRPNLSQYVVGLPLDHGGNYHVMEVLDTAMGRVQTRYDYFSSYDNPHTPEIESDMHVRVTNTYTTGNGAQAVINKVFTCGFAGDGTPVGGGLFYGFCGYEDHGVHGPGDPGCGTGGPYGCLDCSGHGPIGSGNFNTTSRQNTWAIDGRAVDEDTVFYATMSIWVWNGSEPGGDDDENGVQNQFEDWWVWPETDVRGYYIDDPEGLGYWKALEFEKNPVTGDYDLYIEPEEVSGEPGEDFTFHSAPVTYFPFSVNEPATLNNLGFSSSYKITEYVLDGLDYVPIETLFRIGAEPDDERASPWVAYEVRHTINFRFPENARSWTEITTRDGITVGGNITILTAAGINQAVYEAFEPLQLLSQTQAVALMAVGAMDAGQLDGTAPVYVYNNFRPGEATLRVDKAVADWPDHFVDEPEDMMYYIRVIDETDGTTLLWRPERFDEGVDAYHCIGNDVDGFSETAGIEDIDPGNPFDGLTVIQIRVGQPVELRNLWSERNYRVEEVLRIVDGDTGEVAIIPATLADAGYTPSVTYATPVGLAVSADRIRPGATDRVFLINGDVAAVTLTNTYPPYYTVTYDANGGSGAPLDSARYAEGAAVTVLDKGEMTRPGYDFTGWNTQKDGKGDSYRAADTFQMPDENLSLYAQWDAIDYSVTYYPGGAEGDVPVDLKAYHVGDDVDVAAPTGLTYSNYRFMGWRANLSGTPLIQPGEEAFKMPPADVELAAEWAREYKVTYDGNGHSSGTVPPEDGFYITGETTRAAAQGTMDRRGYTFTGWNTLSNGGGTPYAAGAAITIVAVDVTLYAQWRHDQYTVTYDGNENTVGAPPAPENHFTDDAVTVKGPGTLGRDGYKFMGWRRARTGGGTEDYLAGQTFDMPESNVTLMAIWAPAGDIRLTKTLAGSYSDWAMDENTPFYIRIWDVPDLEDSSLQRVMLFERSLIDLPTGDYSYTAIGYKYGDDIGGWTYEFYLLDEAAADFVQPVRNVDYFDEIPITQNMPQWARGLLAGDGHHYYIEELPNGLSTPGILTTTYEWQRGADGRQPCGCDQMAVCQGLLIPLIIGDADIQVYVTNDYTQGAGQMIIRKIFPIAAEDEDWFTTFSFWDTWPIDRNTPFYVEIEKWVPDESEAGGTWTRLRFTPTGPSTFDFFGVDGVTGEGVEDTVTMIPFSVNNRAILSGMDSTWDYRAAEYWYDEAKEAYLPIADAFEVAATGEPWVLAAVNIDKGPGPEAENASIPEEKNITVTVTNTFRPGVAELTVTKERGGTTPGWWEGTEVFYIQIRDVTDGNILRWIPDPFATEDALDIWRCVGNEDGGFSEVVPYDPELGTEAYTNTLTIRVGETVTLNNLWTNREYEVIERLPSDALYTPTPAFTVEKADTSSEGAKIFLNNGDLAQVTVTNTYPDYYQVTYVSAGHISGTVPTDDNYYIAGTAVTVAGQGSLLRPGYDFRGWTADLDEDGTPERYTTTLTMPPADVTLTALWEAIDYNVTYFPGGAAGGVPVDPQEYHIGDDVDVAEPSGLTRPGYRFMGWRSDLSGTPLFQPGENLFKMPAADVELTAEWSELFYVTYDANGGENPPEDDGAYIENENVTILGADEDAPTRTGYTFEGWHTDPQGKTGTAYTPGETYGMPKGDLTLYAQWDALVYTITYVANNGTEETDTRSPYTIEDKDIPVLAPADCGVEGFVYEGYLFLGWSADMDGDDGGDGFCDPGDLFDMPLSNVTFTALWARDYSGGLTVEKMVDLTGPDAERYNDPDKPYDFYFRVYRLEDAEAPEYLYFMPDPEMEEGENLWIYVEDPLEEDIDDGVVTTEILFRVDLPAVLKGLPTAVMYEVEEVVGFYDRFVPGNWWWTPDFNPIKMPHEGNLSVMVINGPKGHLDGGDGCRVTYDGNGYTGPVPYDVSAYPEGFPVYVLGPTDTWHDAYNWPMEWTGYKFIGWNTSADGKGTAYLPTDWVEFDPIGWDGYHIMPDQDVTLYAQWQRTQVDPPPQCTVTFHWNYDRADDGIYLRVAVPRGSPVAAPMPPLRQGFTFRGWFLDPACTLPYDFATPVTADLDLYARWEVALLIPFAPEHYAYLVGENRGRITSQGEVELSELSENYISPERNITRAEVATIFFR